MSEGPGAGTPVPDGRANTTPMGQLKAVDTSEASSALDKRKTIIGAIVTLVVLVIIFVGLIPKFGSYADAWDQIQGMTPLALALIGVSVLVMLVVWWRRSRSGKTRIPRARASWLREQRSPCRSDRRTA